MDKKAIPELTRMSSKGQVVIPKHMRKNMHIAEGSVFAISSFDDDMLLLKKVENPITKEELELAKEAKNAWEEVEKGEYTESSAEDFLKELGKLISDCENDNKK
ncbi:MAG: AbrB/MazE/SpoVT family DNA-binding domain-containing protein [Candidatus Aenigmarchaeota archaeon]|nr:AbrB/MazE/SpoVT family DNA-binding domain-containing protein [Candidatus Aenigmarchaeota archaeon]